MTLREKFDEIFIENWLVDYTEECEKITDEFAIGFLNWIILKCDYQKHGIFEYQGEEYTNEELLQIYKKEKGL